MKHTLRLADREISSGNQGEAIASVKLTRRVNRGEELALGSVCPGMLEVSLLELAAPICVGEKLELLDEAGSLLGTFYCQQTETTGALTTLTAYDSLYFLDRDVTPWLLSLDCWPYTLEDFAHLVCRECGVVLADDPIANGGYPIEKFTGSTTGRALLSFVGELTGCYLAADETGVVHFRWYTPKTVEVPYYLQKKLADFVTAPIDKVQIGATEQDVGAVYPDTGLTNTYRITGNPLVAADALPLAQSLYEKLQQVSYTPGQITLPESCPVSAGDVLTLEGKTFYVMQTVHNAGVVEISCFGQQRLQSVSARNQEKFTSLSGRVLELQTQVEGLKAENRDMAGNLSRLTLEVEGISSQVVAQAEENNRLNQSMTQVSQKADSISATVKQVTEDGVSRVQTQFGVTLDGSSLTIARQDSEITNRLNETGMYVIRAEGLPGQTVMLRADADGVMATDVAVRNFLRLGDHARFEDYGEDRTACYYC